jgi:hypothetical protein
MNNGRRPSIIRNEQAFAFCTLKGVGKVKPYKKKEKIAF